MTERKTNRKTRTDSLRNRERLIDEARLAFAERGISASLEEIARNAGVGIGTLYRHFPKREMLVDEIYREQGERLRRAADALKNSLAPVDALHEWLKLFIESLLNKQIMAGVVSSLTEGESDYCSLSGELLVESLDLLLIEAKQDSRELQDIESLDILCAIAGIATYGSQPGWEEGAKRIVSKLLSK